MSRVELLKPGSGMEGNGRDVPRQWEEAGSWRNWSAFLVFFETQFVFRLACWNFVEIDMKFWYYRTCSKEECFCEVDMGNPS